MAVIAMKNVEHSLAPAHGDFVCNVLAAFLACHVLYKDPIHFRCGGDILLDTGSQRLGEDRGNRCGRQCYRQALKSRP